VASLKNRISNAGKYFPYIRAEALFSDVIHAEWL
jgi:hypothetical protein